MISYRMPAAVVVLAGLTLSVASAQSPATESANSYTFWQHHLWSHKFDTPPGPETTGSIDSQALSSTHAQRPECVPAGLTFSDPPLSDWRIGSCS